MTTVTVRHWNLRGQVSGRRAAGCAPGAFIFGKALTGLITHMRFQYGHSPVLRYHMSLLLLAERDSRTDSSTIQCRLLYVWAVKTRGRVALNNDVSTGRSPQFRGKPLPLAYSGGVDAFHVFPNTRKPQKQEIQAVLAVCSLKVGCIR